MSNLDRANTARKNKTLDRLWRFDDCTESYRDRITRGVYAHAEAKQVPSVTYNRAAYNRMSAEQQNEYDRKRTILKTVYYLIHAEDEGTRQQVNKTVYDYFNAIQTRPTPSKSTSTDAQQAYRDAVDTLNRAYVDPNVSDLDIAGMEVAVAKFLTK